MRLARLGPLGLAAAVALLNTWDVRASRLSVTYLDDAAVHEQMVRFATAALRAGRDPLGAWYPYLNLGSPQFAHYQPLGAMLTGAMGLVVGPDVAFRWTLWLLVGCWPVAVYASARIFGLRPWAAAVAAVVSPLVASVPMVGTEQGAYLWVGYGLWSQLWGTFVLPFAWATTWRACKDRRWILPAGICVAGTVCLHYETGYLALLGLAVLPFVELRHLAQRVVRGAAALVVTVMVAAWVLVPLFLAARWAAVNQALRGTPLEDGYGARRVSSWLFTGGVFDGLGTPSVTILVLLGVLVALIAWRRSPAGRAILILGTLSLLVCFGRTTFGPLVDAVPGSHDIFFRRYMLGAQVAGVWLAGDGVLALRDVVKAGICAWDRHLEQRRPSTGLSTSFHPASVQRGSVALVACLVVATLVPAAGRELHLDRRNASAIDEQRRQQVASGPIISPLIDYVLSHGGGRVYAGSPDNWGMGFTVGAVQVFKYLADRNVDEVGFTLRTAALMSQPEFHFDEDNPSDYELFGIRYLILPRDMPPPVPASSVMDRGGYHLWVLPANGYVSVVDTTGVLHADRSDIGVRSEPYLASDAFADGRALAVAWGSSPPAPLTDTGGQQGASGAPGRVTRTVAALASGLVRTRVHLARRGVVVLSASYDPGWVAIIDGHRVRTQMVSPALVGVALPAGTHEVVFRYHGYRHYDLLLVVLLLGLVVGALAGCPWTRPDRSWRPRRRAGTTLPPSR